jgi:hypothetical protein
MNIVSYNIKPFERRVLWTERQFKTCLIYSVLNSNLRHFIKWLKIWGATGCLGQKKVEILFL